MNKERYKEVYQYDPQSKKLIRKFDTQRDAERELGLYRGAILDYIRNGIKKDKYLFSNIKYDLFPDLPKRTLNIKEILTNEPSPVGEIISSLSEKELRKKHDKYFIILSFLKEVPDGRYIDELSMLRQLSLYGKPGYREAVSRPELKGYKGKVDGVVYYGSVNSINKLKQEGVLQ